MGKLLLPDVAVQQEDQQQIPTTIITTSTRPSPRSSPKKNSTNNDPSTLIFRRNSKFVKARLLLLDTTDTETTTTMMMATASNTSRRSNIFFGVAGMAFFVVLFVTTRLDSIQAASSSNTNTNTNKSGYLNVYGQALQSCSSEGMALTGYTRIFVKSRANPIGVRMTICPATRTVRKRGVPSPIGVSVNGPSVCTSSKKVVTKSKRLCVTRLISKRSSRIKK